MVIQNPVAHGKFTSHEARSDALNQLQSYLSKLSPDRVTLFLYCFAKFYIKILF